MAYQEVKKAEPKMVEIYEKMLADKLDTHFATSTPSILQLQRLVSDGLQHTQKQAKIKGGLGIGLDIIKAVSGVINEAVSVAPQATVVWTVVTFSLEVSVLINL